LAVEVEARFEPDAEVFEEPFMLRKRYQGYTSTKI
jgi:hypothetical protein